MEQGSTGPRRWTREVGAFGSFRWLCPPKHWLSGQGIKNETTCSQAEAVRHGRSSPPSGPTEKRCRSTADFVLGSSTQGRLLKARSSRGVDPELSRSRLLCHCRQDQGRHGDNLTALLRKRFSESSDRGEQSCAADLSGDERVDPDTGGTRNEQKARIQSLSLSLPLRWMDGAESVGYTERELRDGKGLPSPGGWAPEQRNIPSFREVDEDVKDSHTHTSNTLATVLLLSALALGKLQCSPFPVSVVSRIREEVIAEIERGRYPLNRTAELLINFRLLEGLLRASSDPEKWDRMFGCLVVFGCTRREENGAHESSKNNETWRKIWQRARCATGTFHQYRLWQTMFVRFSWVGLRADRSWFRKVAEAKRLDPKLAVASPGALKTERSQPESF